MTTNQTIDGVPRAALLTLLSEPRPDAPHCVLEARAVLCALLDAPLNPLSEIEVLRAAVKELEAMRDARVEAKLVQGEPVAWQYRVSAGPQTGWSLWHDGKGEEFKQSYQVETRPLYAEQPAPVAVMMPGRKGAHHVDWRDFTYQEIGWNACLDEVTRLNSARPTHANPPPGTEPCGTHHDNDGLDEMRKPK